MKPKRLPEGRIPLRLGRDFREADANAVLVSESMARQFWPAANPVGRHMRFTFSPDDSWEVVGVVGDVKIDGLVEGEPTATVYQWSRQRPWTSLWLVARTRSEPSALTKGIIGVIQDVDPEQPVQNVATMDEVIASTLSSERLSTLLLALFAGMAVLLAGVGIYSVLSYAVRRRTREIGIRTALGAGIDDVIRMVLLEGMKPALAGIVVGALGALSLGRVMDRLIYGVKSSDATTLAAVAVLFAAVSALASALPAYRAARVDPLNTLREE